MAKTVVQKYGGSSIADVDRLRRVAEQVVARRRAGDRVVVVVSAMGKSTDRLIEQALSVAPNPSQRELDMLVTAGERISMALLSMAILQMGEEAISFTGSQSGIITDTNHQGARILEVRPYRIEQELDAGRIVIVAGYQGVSLEKEVTTLGRGGSDTSAVALAAALQADACEIYSDVDGVYTADPNVCEQAQLLAELTYEAMQTMAGAGAKVLNADAVDFARRAGIKIHARKTGDASGRQTQVSAAAPTMTGVVAVVGAAHVTRLVGACTDVSSVCERVVQLGGRCLGVHMGSNLDLWIDRVGIPGRESAVLCGLADKTGMQSLDVGVVSLVGHGLLTDAACLPRALATLHSHHVSCSSFLAGDTCVSLAVDAASCDDAVRCLHGHFVDAR